MGARILTRDAMEHAADRGWPVKEVCRFYRVTPSAVYGAQRRYGINLADARKIMEAGERGGMTCGT